MARPAHAVRRRQISTMAGVLALAFASACEYPNTGVVSGTTTDTSAAVSDFDGTTTTAVSDLDVGVEQLRATVIERYPHDVDAFTQGLELDGDVLLESTGLRGRSSLREVDLATGTVLRSTTVDAALFAEGMTVVGDRIIQLTWQAGVAIVYDRSTLTEVDRFSYETEGWGLCLDDDRLVMSDGSSTLTFRDPVTFAKTGSVSVTNEGTPVVRINELECVDGMVYANVWQSSDIVRIDPGTGEVTAVIDASDLYQPAGVEDVLNGIAHDPRTGEFLVTGKLWPEVFRVRFVK